MIVALRIMLFAEPHYDLQQATTCYCMCMHPHSDYIYILLYH